MTKALFKTSMLRLNAMLDLAEDDETKIQESGQKDAGATCRRFKNAGVARLDRVAALMI